MKKLFLFFIFFSNVYALDNFSAKYEVRIRGVHAGEMEFSAVISPETYRVNIVIMPTLAAKMLGYGEIKSSAYGNVVNGKIIPHRYERAMLGKPEYKLHYLFNNAIKSVSIQYKGNEKNINYRESIPLDILSFIIQSLLDKENNVKKDKYSLLSEDKLRTYKVERMRDEQWEENDKVITVSVYRQRNDNRQTFVYFANNPLRLIKLLQIKNDTTQISLKLLNYQKT